MSKFLIYSCVFFSDKYIDLLHLLLKSYKLFGNENNNVEYLIICNQSFENKIMNIFNELNIKGKIWCLNLQTKFEAGYSRLKIFDYPHIQEYAKILYLDCDILITNSLNNILDIPLENKLYGLREGSTNHPFWGGQFFNGEKNIDAFTSGILLFNNHSSMKNVFSQILDHIHTHISNGLEIPICLDQPFIIYHAINNDIYNNSKLIGLVVNNPKQHNKEIISRFPGEPGDYQIKINKMTEFMQNIMFNIKGENDKIFNGIYMWYKSFITKSFITFLDNGKMDAFGSGKYSFINKYLLKCDFGRREHLLKFNLNYSSFISIRKDDFDVVYGKKYIYKLIPKIVMQTSKIKPVKQVIDKVKSYIPDWKYIHFVDSEIIDYFKNNPLSEFPNIITKFKSYTRGEHKADLFRYYYLYLNGGIFLDSDAIFEVDVKNIIKSYDSVFVKSFMPNTHLFNGFIATYPENPIIYDALHHAYQTEDNILKKNYHYLCEELWRIYNKHNLPNMKIYQEYNKTHQGYGGSVILNDNGNKLLSHYFQSKVIPTNTKNTEYNKTEWNNYNKQEINEFDPRVLIGYDCPNPLIRVGPTSDGGYVIVDGLKYDHFIACGIAGDIRFEVAFLNKYPQLSCDAFDGTINNFPRHNKNIKWIKKNIGYVNSDKITNLATYIQNYKNIFLKMDIEGSEFNWIDSMTTQQLNSFSQIVIEVHWPFDTYRCDMLKKLNETHYLVHIHGNNYCDRDIPKHLPSGRTYDGTLIINHKHYPSIKIPEVLEITYIRKNLFSHKLNQIDKHYPTSLDSPNNPRVKDLGFSILKK